MPHLPYSVFLCFTMFSQGSLGGDIEKFASLVALGHQWCHLTNGLVMQFFRVSLTRLFNKDSSCGDLRSYTNPQMSFKISADSMSDIQSVIWFLDIFEIYIGCHDWLCHRGIILNPIEIPCRQSIWMWYYSRACPIQKREELGIESLTW